MSKYLKLPSDERSMFEHMEKITTMVRKSREPRKESKLIECPHCRADVHPEDDGIMETDTGVWILMCPECNHRFME